MTSHAEILEIEGLVTQGSRPGRTVGESVGGILETDSSDWSNGIRYHIFVTRSDTEFKKLSCKSVASLGRAVQVDPIKPTLKAPGTNRLTLKCDEPVSTFAFKLNLRRYTLEATAACPQRRRVRVHSLNNVPYQPRNLETRCVLGAYSYLR